MNFLEMLLSLMKYKKKVYLDRAQRLRPIATKPRLSFVTWGGRGGRAWDFVKVVTPIQALLYAHTPRTQLQVRIIS